MVGYKAVQRIWPCFLTVAKPPTPVLQVYVRLWSLQPVVKQLQPVRLDLAFKYKDYLSPRERLSNSCTVIYTFPHPPWADFLSPNARHPFGLIAHLLLGSSYIKRSNIISKTMPRRYFHYAGQTFCFLYRRNIHVYFTFDEVTKVVLL